MTPSHADAAPDGLPLAVLFDMDGTLVDSEGLWLDAEHDVMARLGGTWSEADQMHCLGGPLERVADYMIERAGCDASTDDVGTMLLDAMETRLRAGQVQWRPGARDLLQECRRLGVPTALVSASWNRLIDAVREQVEADLGMVAFDAVVAGDDVQNSKPHPDPYLTAAALLQAPALAVPGTGGLADRSDLGRRRGLPRRRHPAHRTHRRAGHARHRHPRGHLAGRPLVAGGAPRGRRRGSSLGVRLRVRFAAGLQGRIGA